LSGSENSSSNGKKKGFAGLSSMVSNVDAVIADSAKTAPKPASPSTVSSDMLAGGEPQPASREPIHNAQKNTGSSFEAKILLGFVVVLALIFVIIAARDDRKTASASQAPDSTYIPSTTTTAPAAQPRPAAPSRPTEQRPPAGRNNVLAGAQLRYCVAEQIRVDAAEKVVNNYVDAHVDRFNAIVDDYNSRCGEFRYREGSLQSAQRAMEPYRAELQQEGRGRILRAGITDSDQSTGQFIPDAEPQRPSPDPIVRAVQSRLNQLGYSAGDADGYVGERTVAAIQKFQRDRGLSQDGKPTKLLLLQLNDAQHRPTTESFAPSANSPTTSTRLTSRPPETSTNAADQLSKLSLPERQSLESVCSSAKYTEGPAAYSRCVDRHVASLQGQSPRPSLAALTQPERTSIESACSSAKYTEGPAAYNQCLTAQLRERAVQGGRPDLSRLSGPERTSIESACSSAKYTEGPAAYNRCLTSQLDSLASQGGRPSLAGLSEAERVSIESACSSAKYTEGPASYNRCLTSQLSALSRLPQRANLTNLTATQRRSIESACSSAKYTEGPAAYNTCLLRQVAQL
jgi:peptidoglycan hydrolase-like protein with peptidoglycan-binding domain